jgi:hypothetical protein
MIAAAAAIAGLVVVLVVIFNLTQDEVGHAMSSMSFKGAEVFQDTTSVLRGSINQKVIVVTVEATGKGSPVKINSMVFNASGTSVPVSQNIENARLWYTGTESGFATTQQVGSTIVKVSDQNFEIACNQNLQSGKNYFWLTFDVKQEAAYAPGTIDAACVELHVGAISYIPLISSPIGKRFIEPNLPYYSMGNFSVNNLSAWNSKRDGSGNSPRQLNATRNSFFIQSGHKMISSTGGNLQTLVVEKGGELKITSPLRLNTMYIACGGTVQMDALVTDYYCFHDFFMESGSNYIHNNTGYLPGLHCYFSKRSNQTFFQYGAGTFQYHIAWGNVLIDASASLDLDIQHYFQNVQGDLEIHKTGQSTIGLYNSGADTLNIGGNFVISGGHYKGIQNKESQTLCINVGEDFILRDGAMEDAVTGSSAGNTILKVTGDIVLLSGNFHFANSANSEIVLEGSRATRWIQKPTAAVALGNVIIDHNRELKIQGDRIGDIAAGHTLEVKNGASLYCGNYPVTGPGKFMLNDNSTLGIGSPDGINSTGNSGNILTSQRCFRSMATYAYYTGSQPQVTGVFTTEPELNTVFCLVLDKERSTQELQLSQSFTIIDKVRINKGDIKEGAFELRLPRLSVNK